MKTQRLHQALSFFVCFFLVYTGLSAQEETKSGVEYKPREQKLYIDIPLTIAEDTLINIFGNIGWRLWGPDSEAAYFTADSIYTNINPKTWGYEEGTGGDAFITNQFYHPWAGGMYFASARSNNFNFYWSILSSAFGDFQWEVLGECQSVSYNDLITTTVGGIAVGEIMYRLYVELDKGGVAGKIGSTLLSPTSRINAAIRGYGPVEGSGKIHSALLAFGVSWLTAKFFNGNDEVSSWNRSSPFVDFGLVYGDPYLAESRTPYDQFDLNLAVILSVPPIYGLTLYTDGYLASWLLADDDLNQASNGITYHFDNFITDKALIAELNSGRDNVSFTATSLDYTIKWRRIINNFLELSLKTHIGLSPWSVAICTDWATKIDYNLFLFGGNIKLFLELQQIKEGGGKNGQSLALSLCFYDTWSLPRTPGPDTNTLFLFSKIAYSFPFTGNISFFIADSFELLYSPMKNKEDVEFSDNMRWLNSARLGIKISFF